MDSRLVNKLIRSEIWPVLRSQGFTYFEARTAFQYRGSFVNVVNFQSFNSYTAEVVDCTTYSFAVNLGVYVRGSEREHLIRRNRQGELAPRESECVFRRTLRKRTPVDGFPREDIFYIDADGLTAGPCFSAVLELLTEDGMSWFRSMNDIDAVTSRLCRADDSGGGDQEMSVDVLCAPGSYAWHDLCATLLLLKASGAA